MSAGGLPVGTLVAVRGGGQIGTIVGSDGSGRALVKLEDGSQATRYGWEVRRVWRMPSGEIEHTGAPWRPWSSIHEDYRTVNADGSRWVIANIEGVGTCLVPWLGQMGRRAR